ncbi:hypothetical protein NBRC10512_005390 [Rhodotorula toruloides]|uniref:Polyubiqutin 1 n=1 Tax=Rhodotorula toruloides (strain NP11) TaxID=1130832 RepID=M7X3H6_RHOT1|nr:polyubiqutin 1 [Rhodotorula toruloides NP11]EMS24655.1 polyubiqutin 1 [Rhodotorula toruloides NP11]
MSRLRDRPALSPAWTARTAPHTAYRFQRPPRLDRFLVPTTLAGMWSVVHGALTALAAYNSPASAVLIISTLLTVLLLPFARLASAAQPRLALVHVAYFFTYAAMYFATLLYTITHDLFYPVILFGNVVRAVDLLAYLISLAILGLSRVARNIRLEQVVAALAWVIVSPRVTRKGRVTEGTNGWRRRRRLPRSWVGREKKPSWEVRKERREWGRTKALLALSPSFATEYRNALLPCKLRSDPEPVKNGSHGQVEVNSTERDGVAFKVKLDIRSSAAFNEIESALQSATGLHAVDQRVRVAGTGLKQLEMAHALGVARRQVIEFEVAKGESQVFVRRPDGKTLVLPIPLSATVVELKAAIRTKTGICPKAQVLTLADQVLRGNKKLADYNIARGATIALSLRLRGGLDRRPPAENPRPDQPVDEPPVDCSDNCWIRGGALTAADGNCGIDALRIAMGEPAGLDVSYLRTAMVNVFRHVYPTLENYAPPEMRERGYVTVQTRGHGVECVYNMDELVEWKGQDGTWLDGPDFAVLSTVIGRPVILFSVSQVDYGFPSRTRFLPAPIYTANESTQATIAQVRSLLHGDPHQHPIRIFYDGRSHFVASIDELHGPHAEELRKNTHLLVDDPLQPIFPVQAKLAVPRSDHGHAHRDDGGSPPSTMPLSSNTPPFKPITIPAFGPGPAVIIPRTDYPSADRNVQEPTSVPAHPDSRQRQRPNDDGNERSSSVHPPDCLELELAGVADEGLLAEDWESERDETDEDEDSEMFYDDDSHTASTANFFAPAPPTPTGGSPADVIGETPSSGVHPTTSPEASPAADSAETTDLPPDFNFDESLDVEPLLEEGKVKEWLDVGFAAKGECASVRTAEEASERRLEGPFFLVGSGQASRFEVALPSGASGDVRDTLKPIVLKQQAGGDPTTGVMAADDIEHLNADGDRGIICVFATSFEWANDMFNSSMLFPWSQRRLDRAGSSKLHFIIQADQAGKLVPALIAGNRLHHENLHRLVEKRTAASAVPPLPLGVPATYDTSSFFSWTIVNLPSNKTALFHTKRKVLTRFSLRVVELEEGSANPSNNGSGLTSLFHMHKHAVGSMSAETAMRITIPASNPLAGEVVALTERLISHRFNNGLVLPVSPAEWRGLTKEGLGDLRDAAQAVVNSAPRQMTPVQARTYDLPLASEVVYGEPVGQRLRRRGKDGRSRVSEKLAALDLQAGQTYLVMCSACLEFRVFRCKRTLSTIPHPGRMAPRCRYQMSTGISCHAHLLATGDADEVKRVVDELRSAYKAVAVPIHYDGRVIGSTSTLVDCWYNQLMEDLVGNDAIHNSFAQFVKANPKHPDHPYGVACIEKRLPGMLLAGALGSSVYWGAARTRTSRGAIVLARQHNAVHIWSTRFSPVSEDDPADEVVDAEVRLLLLEGTLMPQDQKTRQGRAGRKPNALVPVTRKPQTDPTKRAEVRSDYRSHRPPSDPNKPIRPASAYLSYQNEIRAAVKANNPDLPPTEINKRIGEMWRALPAEEQETRKSRTKVELEKWTQEMRLWESAQAAKEDQQGALPAAPSGDTNAKRACTTDDEVAPDAAPKPAKTRKRVHGRATLSLSLNLLSTASYDDLSKGTTQKSLSEFRVAQSWSKTVNAFRLKDGTLVHGKEALLRNTIALAQQKQDETSPALPSNFPVSPIAPSTQSKMRREEDGESAEEGMKV